MEELKAMLLERGLSSADVDRIMDMVRMLREIAWGEGEDYGYRCGYEDGHARHD